MIGLGLGLTRGGGIAPSLDLNFLTGTMPSGLTFTRASTATYIGSDGLLKTAAVGEPRFDYDPVTLACKGLLIEESRTNGLPYYNDFAIADWTKTGSSVSAGATFGLDGLLSAAKIVEDTSTGAHMVSDGYNFTAGTTYSVKVVIKPSGRTSAQVILTSTAFGANQIAAFDLANGLATFSASAGVRAFIRQVGFGFYECVFVVTATTTATASLQIRASTSYSAAAPASYTGDGVSGIYVWAAQVEPGAFDTTIIPAVASPVTRAADVLTMTGADFSRWFNPTEGTIVAEFSTITNGLSNTGGNAFPFIYDIDSAAATTSGHSLLASAGYGPGVRAQTQVAGVSQAELTSAVALGTGAIIRHAYTYKANRFAASLNGGAVLTDVLGSLPTPDRLSIGSQDAGGSNTASIHLRRILYYPRGVDDGRVQQLAVAA